MSCNWNAGARQRLSVSLTTCAGAQLFPINAECHHSRRARTSLFEHELEIGSRSRGVGCMPAPLTSSAFARARLATTDFQP